MTRPIVDERLAEHATMRWAVQWRSENRLDGRREYVIWNWRTRQPLLFDTRSEARAFISKEYGYLVERSDLRAEPHGWKMPQAVRVEVRIVVVVG